MNIAQVVRWFCKEQKIMPQIMKMYHVTRPYRLNYDVGLDGSKEINTRYITFDEYVERKVQSYGFSYLLTRVIDDYLVAMRKNMDYNDYWDFRTKLEHELYDVIKKWEYFARHNILLNDGIINIGDKVKFRSWGNNEFLTVTEINVWDGRLYGNIKREGMDIRYSIHFNEVMNDDNSLKNLNDYIIKRKRKIYNGKH